MLRIDLHTHSLMSGHGLNTVYELAAEAQKRGIRILGIVDHGPSMQGAPHEGYFWISDKLDNLKGVKILLGVEANIINKNGKIDLSYNYLGKQRIVIAGIHDKTPYKGSHEDCTTALVNAMNNKYVKVISHPLRTEFKTNIQKIVKAACSTNTLLELNDQLFEKESKIARFLENYHVLVDLCKKSGLPIIIGSDAHVANRVGEDKNVLKVKRLIGLTDNMIINNREKDLELFLRSDKNTHHF